MRVATSWRYSARALRELAATGACGRILGWADAIARWLEERGAYDVGARRQIRAAVRAKAN